MKLALFKVSQRAIDEDNAVERLKAEMRRAYREHISVEDIADACGMPVNRVASIVGAERQPMPPAPGTSGAEAAP